MYGYDPKQRGPEAGSWREMFALVRVVMEVVLPIMLVLAAVLGALIGTLALTQVHAALALIPVALLGGGGTLLIRRERRQVEQERERLLGPRP